MEQFNNINRASSNELIPHSIQERKQVENIRENLKNLLEFEASHFIGYQLGSLSFVLVEKKMLLSMQELNLQARLTA